MTLDSHNLARISTVSASEAIGPEDRAFTPWLAEHIELLSAAVELPMSLGEGDQSLDALIAEHTEVPVGGFRLDIRAFTADGRTVAIENQYGTSDHSHLGQVITYASGVEADVVIWIAERFTDPHVEAIRWLNQRTDESCGVFAVRVEFVKIASSPPAPRFEVEARPSEWARVQRRSQKASRHWTEDEFLSAITSSSEREFVSWIIARARTTGTEVLWLGKKPGGQMNVHPYEFQQCAIGFNISATGEVMVRGLWNDFATVKNNELFAPLADFLGQDFRGRSSGVPIVGLDKEQLWRICDEFSLAVIELLGRQPDS